MNYPSMSDEKRARSRIVRRITVIILAVFLLVIATGAAVSYAFVKRSLEPVDPTSTETVEVEVPLVFTHGLKMNHRSKRGRTRYPRHSRLTR